MKCPHCGKPIELGKTYTDDFLTFWAAYDAPHKAPSASKSDAFKAWQQIESKRPPIEALVVAVKRYHLNVAATSSITCHPSTWLRQGRYESFLPSVPTDTTSSIPSSQVTSTSQTSLPVHPSWPSEVAIQVSALIGQGKFKVWLADSEFIPSQTMGEPVIIKVKSTLQRDWVVQHFAGVLFRTVGAFEIAVQIKNPG